MGATDSDLADFFGVSSRTIARWSHEFSDFCQASRVGKESADERVIRSLFHRAVGYKHEAVKIFMPAGADAPVYAPYTENVPPDTTAAIFWLKNRQRTEWRDRHEYEHGKPGDFDRLTDAELEDRAKELARRIIGGPSGDGEALGPPKPDRVH